MGWPGPLTWRQFTAWRAWSAEEWNRPDRHDHYLMQAAAAFGGGQIDKYRLKFRSAGDKPPVTDVKTATRMAQSRMLSTFRRGNVHVAGLEDALRGGRAEPGEAGE
jgi:hypothetical protein